MPTSEERALEYRAQAERRAAFQRSLQAKLKAPAQPLKDLLEKVKPLRRTP